MSAYGNNVALACPCGRVIVAATINRAHCECGRRYQFRIDGEERFLEVYDDEKLEAVSYTVDVSVRQPLAADVKAKRNKP